jgi:hypothetical protein
MPEHFFSLLVLQTPACPRSQLKWGAQGLAAWLKLLPLVCGCGNRSLAMNLEFPLPPIPAGPMPDIASLRPWQILPPGSRPRITLAADANTESSVGWELGCGTSRTDHSLVIRRARDVRGGNSFERQTVTDAWSRLSAALGLAQQSNSAGSAARPSELPTAELPTSTAAPT